jgi:hypothetical protein
MSSSCMDSRQSLDHIPNNSSTETLGDWETHADRRMHSIRRSCGGSRMRDWVPPPPRLAFSFAPFSRRYHLVLLPTLLLHCSRPSSRNAPNYISVSWNSDTSLAISFMFGVRVAVQRGYLFFAWTKTSSVSLSLLVTSLLRIQRSGPQLELNS